MNDDSKKPRKLNWNFIPKEENLEKKVTQTPVEQNTPKEVSPEVTAQPKQKPVIEEKIEAETIIEPEVESKTQFNPEDNLITVDTEQIKSENFSKKYFNFNKWMSNTAKVKSYYTNVKESIKKNGRNILYGTAIGAGLLISTLALQKDSSDNIKLNKESKVIISKDDKSEKNTNSETFDFTKYQTLEDSINQNKKDSSMIKPVIIGIDSAYTKHNMEIIRNYTDVKKVIIEPNSKKFGWHIIKEEYGLKNNRDIANKINEVAKYNNEHNNQQPQALVDNKAVIKTSAGYQTVKQKDGIMLDLLYGGELLLPIEKSEKITGEYYTDKSNKTYVKENNTFKEVDKKDLEEILLKQAESSNVKENKNTSENNKEVKPNYKPNKTIKPVKVSEDSTIIQTVLDTTTQNIIIQDTVVKPYIQDTNKVRIDTIIEADTSKISNINELLQIPIQDTVIKPYTQDTIKADTSKISNMEELLKLPIQDTTINLNDTIKIDSIQPNNSKTIYRVDTTAVKLNKIQKDIRELASKKYELKKLNNSNNISAKEYNNNNVLMDSITIELDKKYNQMIDIPGTEKYTLYNEEFMHEDSVVAIKARQKASRIVMDSTKTDSLTNIVLPENNINTIYRDSTISDSLKTQIDSYYINKSNNKTTNSPKSLDLWNNTFATGYDYKKLQENSKKEELLSVLLDTYMNNTVSKAAQELGMSKYKVYQILTTQLDGFRKSYVSKYTLEQEKIKPNSSIDNLLVA